MRFLSLITLLALAVASEPCLAQSAAESSAEALPSGATLRLGSTRLRHSGPVQSVAFSPDGKIIVTGGIDGTIRLWDRETFREVRQFTGNRGGVSLLSFSPDGSMLLSAGTDGFVRLWEASTGRELRAFGNQRGGVPILAWSADGKTLVLPGPVQTNPQGGVQESTLRFWDAQTGKLVRQLSELAGTVAATGLALSPDGQVLAVLGQDNRVRLREVATGKEIRQLADGGTAPGFRTPGSLLFSPDSKLLAASNVNQGIHLWETATGRLIHRFTLTNQFAGTYRGLAFSPNSRFLAAAGADRLIRLWGVSSGKELRIFEGRASLVHGIAFSPDGKTLASVGSDHLLHLWDVDSHREIDPPSGHLANVQALAFVAGGKTLVSGGDDGTLRAWDTSTGKEFDRVQENPGFARSLAVFDDQTVFATGFGVNQLCVWQPGKHKEFRRVNVPGNLVGLLSANGRIGATVYGQKVVLVDPATGSELRELKPVMGQYIQVLALSPDGRYLAATANDRTIRLWNTATAREMRSLANSNRINVLSNLVAFAPDGRSLVTVDTGICLWEAATGRERARYARPASLVTALAYSPNGRYLAAGANEGQITVRDLASGRESLPLTGHRGAVRALAFSPDGKRLASGSADTTILLWDFERVGLERAANSTKPAVADVERWWNDLTNSDAFFAHESMNSLIAAGGAAVSVLKEQLKPIAQFDVQRLDRLIADLDDKNFNVREKATAELREMGEEAEVGLLKALANKPPLEVFRRIEDLLQAIKGDVPPQKLRTPRALEVLEQIGTPETRQVLEALAKGAAEAWLTKEAQAGLRRLAN